MKQDWCIPLGELIKLYRNGSKLTLRELETMTGLSNAYISQLENGVVKNPGWVSVIRLVNALDIPLKYVLKAANYEIQGESKND